jgi:hypothetical protein
MFSAAVTIIVELWLDVNTKLYRGEVLMMNSPIFAFCRDVNAKLYRGEVLMILNSRIFAATLRIRLAGPFYSSGRAAQHWRDPHGPTIY